MRKAASIITVLLIVYLTSCVAKKKFTELQDKNKSLLDQISKTSNQLIICEKEKAEALAQFRDTVEQLQKTKQDLMKKESAFNNFIQKINQKMADQPERFKIKEKESPRNNVENTNPDTITSIFNPFSFSIYVAIKNNTSQVTKYKIEAGLEVKFKNSGFSTFTINGEKGQCIGKIFNNSQLEVYWEKNKKCYSLKERKELKKEE